MIQDNIIMKPKICHYDSMSLFLFPIKVICPQRQKDKVYCYFTDRKAPWGKFVILKLGYKNKASEQIQPGVDIFVVRRKIFSHWCLDDFFILYFVRMCQVVVCIIVNPAVQRWSHKRPGFSATWTIFLDYDKFWSQAMQTVIMWKSYTSCLWKKIVI